MNPARTPNYRLTQDYSHNAGGSGYGQSDYKLLYAGTFVRPIELCYVPKHILDRFPSFDRTLDVFCYSAYGMFPIPRKLVKET